MPTREEYSNLFRILDKIKITESKNESRIGGKKEDTMASMAEEIRNNLTRTMLQQTGESPEGKNGGEEFSFTPPVPADYEKLEKKDLAVVFRKMLKHIEMQKQRIGLLTEKIEKKSQNGNIAEFEVILEDIKYYQSKIQRQKVIQKQTNSIIDSQKRLLAKENIKV